MFIQNMTETALGFGSRFAAASAGGFPDAAPVGPGPGPVPAPEPSHEPEPPPPPRRTGGFWGLLALLVGAGVGVWLYQSPSQVTNFSSGGASAFRTVRATTGELRETLRVGGSIRAEDFAAIRAPRIRSGSRGGGGGGASMTLIHMADAGTFVNKGDVVAEFDRQSQQQQIDDQEANVVQAEALVRVREANLMIELETKRQDLVTAKAEHAKAELDLCTAPVRSKIEGEVLANARDEAKATFEQLEQEVNMLEQAQAAALRQAQIDLQQERVDLKRAEMNAEHMLLQSPLDGIVVHETTFRGGTFAQVSSGDEVRSGTLFMQIVNPRSMVLEGQLNQADSQKVRMGQRAEVRLDAYPDEVFEGRVRSVSAIAGGSSDGRSRSGSGDYVRQISVTIDIVDQDARIIPDLSASADIVLNAYDNVVTAPREALDRVDEEFFVWVRNPAQPEGAQRRRVEVSAFNDTHAVIADGLAGGEMMEVRVEDSAALYRAEKDARVGRD